MRKKYKKSRKQHHKEMERRRKLRQVVLNRKDLFTQDEFAKALGCSQATVSRDLRKLRGTRWDPIEHRLRRIRERIIETLEERRRKMRELINSLSDSQLIELVAVVGETRRKKGVIAI